MVERQSDIDFLNRFLSGLWSGISDILTADITHRAFSEMEGQPVRMSRRRTRLNLSTPPAFATDQSGNLMLRIPERGAIQFSTRIFLLPRLPWPRITVDVDISLDVRVDAHDEPVTDIDVVVNSNWLGQLINRFVDWQGMIRDQFSSEEVMRELGYFSLARYAPSDVPAIPAPELVSPDRPRLENAVNLVLVPESFSGGDFSRFEETVNSIVKTLNQPDASGANEPYHSFRTAISVWTIKPDQTPDGDHVMGSFKDPRGHQRVALSNLARLSAIGRVAESVGPGLTLLVFIVNPDAPRFEGNRPTAMALGNVALQPLQETPQEDAWLLLHELAHTSLAHLGDEYVLRSRRDDRYLGLPPRQPNLTSDPRAAKWKRWIDANASYPAWDQHPITGAEGAGYFGSGIWRPTNECAMKTSKEGVPFCAVCREALTNGFRQALGQDRAVLGVDYPSGDRSHLQVVCDEAGRAKCEIPVPDGPARMRFSLVAATLPEPWGMSVSLPGDADPEQTVDEDSEHEATIMAVPDTRVTLRIASRCPFTPWDQTPTIETEIEFMDQDSGL